MGLSQREQDLQNVIENNREREQQINDSSRLMEQTKDEEINKLQSYLKSLQDELQLASEDSKVREDVGTLILQVKNKAESKIESLQNRIKFLEGELSNQIVSSRQDANCSIDDISKIGSTITTMNQAPATNLSSDILHSLVGFLDQCDQGTQVDILDMNRNQEIDMLRETMQDIKDVSKKKFKLLEERKDRKISELENEVISLKNSLEKKNSILSKGPADIANYGDIEKLFSAVNTLDLENQKLKKKLHSSQSQHSEVLLPCDNHHYLNPIHHEGTVHNFHGVVRSDGHIDDIYAGSSSVVKSPKSQISLLEKSPSTMKTEKEIAELHSLAKDLHERNQKLTSELATRHHIHDYDSNVDITHLQKVNAELHEEIKLLKASSRECRLPLENQDSVEGKVSFLMGLIESSESELKALRKELAYLKYGQEISSQENIEKDTHHDSNIFHIDTDATTVTVNTDKDHSDEFQSNAMLHEKL